MSETSLIQKIIWFVKRMRREMFCHHYQIFTRFSSEVFRVENFKTCSGASSCVRCGKHFSVYVPENQSEVDNLIWKSIE